MPPARAPLPIDEALPALVAALRAGQAAVLQAPPGAGKTTRVPLALSEAGLLGDGQLLMLEPRRIAARAAARTLATNLGERPGGTVGYQVRFEKVASKDTRILVVTEGILSRRFLSDALLEGTSVVVLDEFHERSVHTDLALAFLRELMSVRDDLKVLVMSATLDAAAVARFLGDCPVVTSAGRPFPVDVRFADKKDDRPLDERVAGAVRNLVVEPGDDGGDVLCFLPGAPEIRRAQERLAERALVDKKTGEPLEVVPLYGALTPEEQDRAIERGARRRVVLATNVAETSLTLEGVSAVVDGGLMKAARHDPATDREHLDTVRISLASAEQRAGRAGRLRPGRCVRLWTKLEHQALEPSFAPELLRADLARVALDVLAFHPGPLASFAFFERPSDAALKRAVALLSMLGALDHSGERLSERGRRLAELPVQPRTGALLLEGARLGHPAEIALFAAILEDDRSWPREDARTATDSDVALIAERRLPEEVRRAARDLARQVRAPTGLPAVDDETARRRALVAAYPDRVCKRRRAGEPEAAMVGGRGVRLSKESGVKDAELFLALALEGGDRTAARVRVAEAIALEDVRATLPHLVTTADEAVFDEGRGALAGVRRTRVADLIVEEKSGLPVAPEAAAAALAEAFVADFARRFRPDDETARTLARLRFAALALPEVQWPPVDEAGLKALVPDLCVGKRTLDAVAAADWKGALLGRLSWADRKLLDHEVPPRLEVPTGNHLTVDYQPALEGGAPVLAVRLQELFGLTETPKVAKGRVAVVLHLLSPGYKPVQVTSDLASFWRVGYPEVRGELRARYPKHSWPDDPLTAAPTARGRPRR
ncbi:MAG: ATP-dependent helicase HrpB [Deltaproteobacteria bacterium]|nr:ATP-dependent helicase HrpB [Deltaproteobacteria bacterium]